MNDAARDDDDDDDARATTTTRDDRVGRRRRRRRRRRRGTRARVAVRRARASLDARDDGRRPTRARASLDGNDRADGNDASFEFKRTRAPRARDVEIFPRVRTRGAKKARRAGTAAKKINFRVSTRGENLSHLSLARRVTTRRRANPAKSRARVDNIFP